MFFFLNKNSLESQNYDQSIHQSQKSFQQNSKQNFSKKESSNREVSNREASKREVSKKEVSKREVSKREVSQNDILNSLSPDYNFNNIEQKIDNSSVYDSKNYSTSITQSESHK